MKKILYTLLLLLTTGPLMAQNSYTLSSVPFNPDPYTVGTQIVGLVDDIYSSKIALPFSFCFYDQSYDTIVVGSNGIVTFDLSQAGMYCPWPIGNPVPNSSMTDLSIMAPVQDIDPSVGGAVRYDVAGVAPFRRFIISYFEIPMFSCNSMLFSEQVILYESSNIVETHILNKPLCTTWNGGAAVHGIQVNASTGFVAPGRNFPTQWTTTNDGYRFTPVGACAGPVPADSVLGKVYTDYNNNCVMDPNEFAIQNRLILANGGQYYAWTGTNGHYGMGLAAGSYVVSEVATSPFYASSCVSGGVYNVTLANTTINNADFADSVSTICSDISVNIGTSAMRRCGTSVGAFTYCNNGSYPDSSVVVTVTLNDSIAIDSASAPYTSLGSNQYAFAVGDLMPGQCGTVQFWMAVGCDTAGTVYCIGAEISGTYPTDCDTLNNASTDCHALVAAFDPNEKLVASQNGLGYVRNDDIDANDDLTYMITFQNLGTSYAEDVEIRDTLDAAQLRLETFQAGAGIAPYNYAMVGNTVIFRFENIMLPAATTNEPQSHGFVKFSISQQPGHGPGTVIHNQAAIYFDHEAPVITNQTTNTIPLASGTHLGLAGTVKVFPNPGRDQLLVERSVTEEMTFLLLDITGKEVRRQTLAGLRTAVHTADLMPGIYLYRLESNGQLIEAGKWVRQ